MTPPTLERWRNYMRECPSPDTWIDLGWYFAVSAALQRRVWYGDFKHNPTFVNVYFVFVGPAGCGKGLVLGPVSDFFTNPSMRKNQGDRTRDARPGEKLPMKVALGPSDGSYQAIMDMLVENTQTYRYEAPEGSKSYIHASLAIILDEMNSLFKRNSNEVANFLLKTYDCKDHEYVVRHSKSNYIQRTCISLLAGCTNTMLKDAARYGIFEDGFVSRCLFAFEFAPKFVKFDINSHYDDTQKADHAALQEHINKLTGLYGQIEFSPAAHEYMRSMFETYDAPKIAAARSKMQTYYARKAILLKKLAALAHFASSFTMTIEIEDCVEARRIADMIEPKMIAGFNSVGRNEYSLIMKDIKKFVSNHPQGVGGDKILIEFHAEVNHMELLELLASLVMMGEVVQRNEKYYGK